MIARVEIRSGRVKPEFGVRFRLLIPAVLAWSGRDLGVPGSWDLCFSILAEASIFRLWTLLPPPTQMATAGQTDCSCLFYHVLDSVPSHLNTKRLNLNAQCSIAPNFGLTIRHPLEAIPTATSS